LACTLVDLNDDGMLDLVCNNVGQDSTVLLGNPALGTRRIPVTVNELFRKLAILTDYELEPNYGPRRKGDVFRIALDNTRARRELGWEPKLTLEEGLTQTVAYFRQRVLSTPD